MMKKIFIILIGVATFSVTACSPIYKTGYNYAPPPSHEGLMCVDHCMGMKTLCEQTCETKQSKCEYDAKKDASDDYDHYVREREYKGREVKKDKYDFDRSSSCSQSSCQQECAENYNSCYSSCGGGVSSSKQCTAFCDK